MAVRGGRGGDYNPDEGELWLAGCGFDLASCFPEHAVPPVVLLLAQYFENTLNQGFLTEKVGVACTTPVLTPSPHPVHRPRRHNWWQGGKKAATVFRGTGSRLISANLSLPCF